MRRAIAIYVILTAVICSMTFLISQAWAKERPVVRIAMVIDGPWEGNEPTIELFKTEITQLLQSDFDVRFPAQSIRIADWQADTIRSYLNALLADPSVDMVLAMGIIASHYACHLDSYPKPLIAPYVLNTRYQNIVFDQFTSGVHNLNYVTQSSDFEAELRKFKEIVPFTHMAFFQNKAILTALPWFRENMQQAAQRIGITAYFIELGQSLGNGLAQLDSATDAVYISPMLNLPSDEMATLIGALQQRNLPSFTTIIQQYVASGILAGWTLKADFQVIARRVAVNIQRTLFGEDLSTLPVNLQNDPELIINMATARAIGVWPDFDILTEAKLINEEPTEGQRVISLQSVVHEAIAANLDLAVQNESVMAGSYNVREAITGYMPKIDISTKALFIDDDQSRATMQSEQSMKGYATMSQLIFSEKVLSNISIEKHIQKSRIQRRREVFLDIALGASTTYLDVLKAKTYERIQKENLELTNSNLKLARIRQSIGVAGPGEVYRWENQMALNKTAVIQAQAQRKILEATLNSILHRPLEEHFRTIEVDINNPTLITSDTRFSSLITNPWTFKLFRDFMTQDALSQMPELGQLDQQIAAKERAIRSLGWDMCLPTVTLEGSLTQLFGATGEQTSRGSMIRSKDSTDMSIGLVASFPLFEGGSKYIRLKRAKKELAQLRLERASLAEQMELKIRSSFFATASAHANIDLANDAAEAARNNLNLVKDSYSRGVVSILDLLDAQNAALIANLEAANAVYDFLTELMHCQRNTNKFDFFISIEQRNDLVKRLESYLQSHGTVLPHK